MNITYQLLASIAQSAGVLLFMGAFLLICGYALWPRHRDTFERAAHLPLSED
jgi:cytochrome c oxidase cbb3-type subunit 4